MAVINVTIDSTGVESKLAVIDTKVAQTKKNMNTVSNKVAVAQSNVKKVKKEVAAVEKHSQVTSTNLRFAFIQWSQVMRGVLGSFKQTIGIQIAMGVLDTLTYVDMMRRFSIEGHAAMLTGNVVAGAGLYALMAQTSYMKLISIVKQEQTRKLQQSVEEINIMKGAYG